MRMDKGKSFMHLEADGQGVPVFSGAFLYEAVGKEEARFILGVAEEYEHIIEALGPTAIRAILDVRPRLAHRLGLPETVVNFLSDARSEMSVRREEQMPSQVILDDHLATSVWQLLHDEYQRTFDPEKDMDRDHLRSYNILTDALGEWTQRQRKTEQDRLPEKLEKQKARRAEIAAKRAAKAER